jgi:hypothetical protein
MKKKTVVFLAILFGLAPGFTFAQDTASTPKPKSEVRTITGCLSKGDSANEFLLTGNDGSTWEVRSKRVTLADHVGHTVTAHGVVSHSKMHNMKEDAKDAAVDSGVKKDDAEHGHLAITSVKMVSESCKK